MVDMGEEEEEVTLEVPFQLHLAKLFFTLLERAVLLILILEEILGFLPIIQKVQHLSVHLEAHQFQMEVQQEQTEEH
jgi:hypothetical protein